MRNEAGAPEASCSGRAQDHAEDDYLVRQALAEPMVWEWEGKAVHEWRLYVTEEVQAIWHTFTPEQKVAIMRMADHIAGNENWD